MRAVCGALVAALIFLTSPAFADAGWFEQGDTVLRNDLMLLNDADVIRLPVNQWPLPRAAVRYALENAKEHFVLNAAVEAALARVRARVDADRPVNRRSPFDATATAGAASLLRDFDSLSRERAELAARAAHSFGERAEVSIRLTGAVDPQDDQSLRADGSHATVQLGNWLLSANTLDRWWGPAHESSLILSNNARPMPTVMVERAAPEPFKSRWLNWLGPWRFSFGIGRMEGERQDIDAPLFMTWRVVVMPFKDIELGFSRTAQFCGEQLPCDLDTFGNMIAGNDNPGFDATPETEPGNQMAGFDMRWASPIGTWPYAVYSQMIGEDESGYLPVKYLAQFGAETWKTTPSGGLVLAYLEYSDTTCSANSAEPRFGCAYNQAQFDVEGYRYRGRVIGHTTDRDAQSWALGGTYTSGSGQLWTATARTARLNRQSTFDPNNTVSSVRAEFNAIEFGWRGQLFGQRISVDIGVEALESDGSDREVEPFGFVSWHHEFRP